MDSASHIDRQALSELGAASEPGVELRAPAKVIGKRDRRDWLSTSWTALLIAYAAAVLSLLGGAIVHAL